LRQSVSAGPVLLLLGRSSTGQQWRSELLDALSPLRPLVTVHKGPLTTSASTGPISALALRHDVTAIVAIGGGTIIDAGKLVRNDLERDHGKTPFLVTVPTVAGSGAEVTPFAVMWDVEEGRKLSVSLPRHVPEACLVDPALNVGVPPGIAAASALDALTQGVEAAWSTRSTAASAGMGLRAVRLVADHLATLLRQPDDLKSRVAISWASIEAGRAISISETTACHAVSYPLTLRYGWRHGEACSFPLASFLVYNSDVTEEDCVDGRGARHVHLMINRIIQALSARTVLAASERIAGLRAMAVPEAGSGTAIEIAEIARAAIGYERLDNNPRKLTQGNLIHLLNWSCDRPPAGRL
jgi:alcohol dehydrogenase class IV